MCRFCEIVKKVFSIILLVSGASVFAQELGSETEVLLRNIDSKMLLVPGGTFCMGAENYEANELPRHNVLLNSFYISKTEVTQEEYLSVMGKNLSVFRGDKNPVEEVSWYDAVVFCNRLSIMDSLEPVYMLDGKTNPDEWGDVPRIDGDRNELSRWNKIEWNHGANGYRLPTEAEWEYASRGAALNGGQLFSGSENLENVGWAESNSEKKSHECGSKNANAIGIFDMSGNVWEWCWDWYGRYSIEAYANPFGALESASGRRVRKGGSFKTEDRYCRNSNRASSEPEIRGRDLGFRIAKSADVAPVFCLEKNAVDIDSENFPFMLVTNSYMDERSASLEKNRLQAGGIGANVIKLYSAEKETFVFDVALGFYRDSAEAIEAQNQFKNLGVKKSTIKELAGNRDFDLFVKENPVAFDDGPSEIPNTLSESVRECLEMIPSIPDFQIDYMELADLDNMNGAGKNLSGLMLEDFFADSVQNLHAASYAEFSDKLDGRSLIVVAAKSSEGTFSSKAETFASSFMDGVYSDGSFSLQLGPMDCTVVVAYNQLVLCGNSSDGSTYLLMFARGFTKERLYDLLQDSSADLVVKMGGTLRKTLLVIPGKNASTEMDFMNLVLQHPYLDEESESKFEAAVVDNWKMDADFVQSGKEILLAVYQMEYYCQAEKKYLLYNSENPGGENLVLFNAAPAVKLSLPEKNVLTFAQKSYIISLESKEAGLDDLESIAGGMNIWR